MAAPGLVEPRAERVRLFFALWPDDGLRRALAERIALLPDPGAKARRTDPSLYHLTLLFLGNLPPAALATARGLRVGGQPFRLTLDRAGCFRQAQVWWLGAGGTPPALERLWLDLRAAAAAAGLEFDERPLAPHVTCVRRATTYLRPQPLPPLAWGVRSFVLMRSRSVAGGARYEVVREWPLAGPSGP